LEGFIFYRFGQICLLQKPGLIIQQIQQYLLSIFSLETIKIVLIVLVETSGILINIIMASKHNLFRKCKLLLIQKLNKLTFLFLSLIKDLIIFYV